MRIKRVRRNDPGELDPRIRKLTKWTLVSKTVAPIIQKHIFNDEKQEEQEHLAERVQTGLDDLLFTYKELQLRKQGEGRRDNAVEWPSRRKHAKWERPY